MKIIELDLTNCRTLYDLHERIRIAFDFPDWYGKNWSAFWDLLWSECDADKVIIRGERSLPEGFRKQLEIMHKILDDKIEFNKQCQFNAFSYDIVN
ncbi:MAG: hypothetical protein E7553_00520 [Ruminococcaceae bacterium]|nr:hypothetical protein [Oscillospiraceae bacterium]